jgi:MFS family permease
VLAVLALALATRAPETHIPRPGGALWRSARVSGGRDRRFVTVVAPLAPWVFGSAAVALAYLPGLVRDQLGPHALVFGAVVTMLSALAGILIQPLARRVDDRDRPRRLRATSLALVVVGLGVATVAAATTSPAAVVAAVLVLGAGYGSCQVCGLLEVQRLAGPDNLARLTAVYPALSYLGFALPFLIAAAETLLSPAGLLLVVAALAVLTLAWMLTVPGTGQP